MVKQIKDILTADITSESSQEKLEGFKRDANAYGGQPDDLLQWQSSPTAHPDAQC